MNCKNSPTSTRRSAQNATTADSAARKRIRTAGAPFNPSFAGCPLKPKAGLLCDVWMSSSLVYRQRRTTPGSTLLVCPAFENTLRYQLHGGVFRGKDANFGQHESDIVFRKVRPQAAARLIR